MRWVEVVLVLWFLPTPTLAALWLPQSVPPSAGWPDPAFRELFNAALQVGVPEHPAHQALAAQVRTQQDRRAELDAPTLTTLGGDLLRLRQLDAAFDVLTQTRTRFPQHGPAYAHLALVLAARGQWREAAESQRVALDLYPSSVLGVSAETLAWYQQVDQKYLLKLFRLRAREAETQPAGQRPSVTTVDALFAFQWAPPDYLPGRRSADELAELPPDALPAMQQLVLWLPDDARLYWLLGELHNALDQLGPAAFILDDCVRNRAFQTPTLRAHRQILNTANRYRQAALEVAQREIEQRLAAVEAERTPTPTATAVEWPSLVRVFGVGVLTGMFVLVIMHQQLRRWRRPRA
jgi:tetratricopeptide (TPR) repeat protein